MPQKDGGSVKAGVGTLKSAKDPATPKAMDASKIALFPPGTPSGPHLAFVNV